jgi:hypothetical protein
LRVALEGELEFFPIEGQLLFATAGLALGGEFGDVGAILPYVQPRVVLVTGSGFTEADFGVRSGVEIRVAPRVELRGDVVLELVGEEDDFEGEETEFGIGLYAGL